MTRTRPEKTGRAMAGDALARAERERDEARRTTADLERILLNEGNVESAAVRPVAAAIRERNEAREAAALTTEQVATSLAIGHKAATKLLSRLALSGHARTPRRAGQGFFGDTVFTATPQAQCFATYRQKVIGTHGLYWSRRCYYARQPVEPWKWVVAVKSRRIRGNGDLHLLEQASTWRWWCWLPVDDLHRAVNDGISLQWLRLGGPASWHQHPAEPLPGVWAQRLLVALDEWLALRPPETVGARMWLPRRR